MHCSDIYIILKKMTRKTRKKLRNKNRHHSVCVNLKTKQAIPRSDNIIRVTTTAARALMCFSDLSNSWSAALGQSQSRRTSTERELPCTRNTETWRL